MTVIVVADTSVLINFLRIDRMDLLRHYPGRFLATDHVAAEIEDDEQRARYNAAVVAGIIDTCIVDNPEEVALYMRLNPGRRLGHGECSAIAVALKRRHTLAIDDNKALHRALREADLTGSRLQVVRTPDVMVSLIRSKALTVAEADRIKDTWARHHRFRIKAGSFKELL